MAARSLAAMGAGGSFGGVHRRFAPEPVARLRCHYKDIVRASRLGHKASVRVDSLSSDWSVAPRIARPSCSDFARGRKGCHTDGFEKGTA